MTTYVLVNHVLVLKNALPALSTIDLGISFPPDLCSSDQSIQSRLFHVVVPQDTLGCNTSMNATSKSTYVTLIHVKMMASVSDERMDSTASAKKGLQERCVKSICLGIHVSREFVEGLHIVCPNHRMEFNVQTVPTENGQPKHANFKPDHSLEVLTLLSIHSTEEIASVSA